MVRDTCKTCNRELYANHFFIVKGKFREYFKNEKCKLCSGNKILNQELEFCNVDYNRLMLLLTRLHFNDGGYTIQDMEVMQECFDELYGDNVKIFVEPHRLMEYQWMKLRYHWNLHNEFKF